MIATAQTEKPNAGPESAYIAALEFAQIIDVSIPTFNRMKSAKRLPKHVVTGLGNSHRWNRAEVMDWLAAGAPDQKTWEAMRAHAARQRA